MVRLVLLYTYVFAVPLAFGQITVTSSAPESDASAKVYPKANGYHGIWYCNQKTGDEYVYKYSGGLGTYCAKHIPLAYYAEKADKTFFVYGGMPADGHLSKKKRTLLIMVSYYDHETGLVPRPTLLMDKKTADSHDNPTIMLDDQGYVWVFVGAHGKSRPSYVFKSAKPYEIDAFELVRETNFSYPQPWHVPGKGFLFLHTRYEGGRKLYAMTSRDGHEWNEPRLLASIQQGHYQISWRYKDKIGTAFNYHPDKGGLNARTNLYYIQSKDFGKTWLSANGKKMELPLTTVKNDALVRDYAGRQRLVYLKDLNFDARGNPIILFVTSYGWQPGPKNGPRKWTTARWDGKSWELSSLLLADNNYDTGCLHMEDRYRWRLIAPTLLGRNRPPLAPQPYNPGGEIIMWTSDNFGRIWRPKQLTANSIYNHNYIRRPVNANPDFYAFWADGHGRQPSESRLYFANRNGQVFMLPTQMKDDFVKPEIVSPIPQSQPTDGDNVQN